MKQSWRNSISCPNLCLRGFSFLQIYLWTLTIGLNPSHPIHLPKAINQEEAPNNMIPCWEAGLEGKELSRKTSTQFTFKTQHHFELEPHRRRSCLTQTVSGEASVMHRGTRLSLAFSHGARETWGPTATTGGIFIADVPRLSENVRHVGRTQRKHNKRRGP